MSATEVIEEIKRLPLQEREKVLNFLQSEEAHATAEKVSPEFKAIADEVFTKNAELFRKLAQ
jgi:hypothetical protein